MFSREAFIVRTAARLPPLRLSVLGRELNHFIIYLRRQAADCQKRGVYIEMRCISRLNYPSQSSQAIIYSSGIDVLGGMAIVDGDDHASDVCVLLTPASHIKNGSSHLQTCVKNPFSLSNPPLTQPPPCSHTKHGHLPGGASPSGTNTRT